MVDDVSVRIVVSFDEYNYTMMGFAVISVIVSCYLSVQSSIVCSLLYTHDVIIC